MQQMHAVAPGYRAAVITSIGSYVFVLRLFDYCMGMVSVMLLDL